IDPAKYPRLQGCVQRPSGPIYRWRHGSGGRRPGDKAADARFVLAVGIVTRGANDTPGIVDASRQRSVVRSRHIRSIEHGESVAVGEKPVPELRHVVEVGPHHLAPIIDAVQPSEGTSLEVDRPEGAAVGHESVLDVQYRVEVAANHLADIVDV